MSRQEFEKRFPGDEACARHLAELRWTSLRARRLADALSAEGYPVSELTVNRMLHSLGYSLQSNRTTVEGRQLPDRDVQFRRMSRGCGTSWGHREAAVPDTLGADCHAADGPRSVASP
ncbi:MAG: hypothetical protein OXH76_05140 [Boseongicola sp.]|nr:hypothetical protein [Boseongicola sp.]